MSSKVIHSELVKEYKVCKTLKKVFRLNKVKGERLTVEEISNLIQSLKENSRKKGINNQVMIRGLNGNNYKTLKKYVSDTLEMKEFEEYYSGIDDIESNKNFMEFYQIQLYIKSYV